MCICGLNAEWASALEEQDRPMTDCSIVIPRHVRLARGADSSSQGLGARQDFAWTACLWQSPNEYELAHLLRAMFLGLWFLVGVCHFFLQTMRKRDCFFLCLMCISRLCGTWWLWSVFRRFGGVCWGLVVLGNMPNPGHMAEGLVLLPSADKRSFWQQASNSGQKRRNISDN